MRPTVRRDLRPEYPGILRGLKLVRGRLVGITAERTIRFMIAPKNLP
jgi:hypothetical protein